MRAFIVTIIAFNLAALPVSSAEAQFSASINIGVNVPAFPDLVPVPGYPVYYDPYLDSNYFFYDGQYWVYDNDYWYTSDWYNGPWQLVEPDYVPIFILRVPVRYYRRPPTYFGGWQPDRPPRWEEHWGHDWENHHRGWNQWNHNEIPRPAPLPTYQRQYAGERYPRPEEQHSIREQHYQYKPREQSVQQLRQNLRQDRSQPDRQADQRQINQRVDKPVHHSAAPPANPPANPSAPTRRDVSPPRSQPLPEHSPEVQRRLQRPDQPDNSRRSPEELHRVPLTRPDAPPRVRSRPAPPAPQHREEHQSPPPTMQRPHPVEMPRPHEPPRPPSPPAQHPPPPQREAKKPPHRDE